MSYITLSNLITILNPRLPLEFTERNVDESLLSTQVGYVVVKRTLSLLFTLVSLTGSVM